MFQYLILNMLILPPLLEAEELIESVWLEFESQTGFNLLNEAIYTAYIDFIHTEILTKLLKVP